MYLNMALLSMFSLIIFSIEHLGVLGLFFFFRLALYAFSNPFL